MADARATRGRVLVVEDEAYVRQSMGEMLTARGYDVVLAAGVEPALTLLASSSIDVVITDLKMPAGGGLELVRRAKTSHSDVPVVVLTGFGTVASAVECLQAGAANYILKPAAPAAIEVAIERALEASALRRELNYLRGGEDERDLPIGQSPAWQQVLKSIRAAAPTDSTVLILGESGTGKELLARLVHRWSGRAKGPYVRVNCAAVPMDMWESEFFGHRKGAFTGATADREGRFRLAHRGTLFMDEVGAMALPAQAKILRVVQDGEFDRLGDEQPTRVDVRLVAATNSDLVAEIAAGRFRQDLYYRLNVVRVVVPPLRSRPEDVTLLAASFAAEVAGRLGRATPTFSPACQREMASYAWPGNVRELRNVIERAIILDPREVVESLELGAPELSSQTAGEERVSETNLRQALMAREREVVIEALKRSGGVRKEAARLLGIDQRNLGYYLRKHTIDAEQVGD